MVSTRLAWQCDMPTIAWGMFNTCMYLCNTCNCGKGLKPGLKRNINTRSNVCQDPMIIPPAIVLLPCSSTHSQSFSQQATVQASQLSCVWDDYYTALVAQMRHSCQISTKATCPAGAQSMAAIRQLHSLLIAHRNQNKAKHAAQCHLHCCTSSALPLPPQTAVAGSQHLSQCLCPAHIPALDVRHHLQAGAYIHYCLTDAAMQLAVSGW